jgi:hypothetical protein
MLLQGVRCRRSHPFTVLRDAHSSPTKPYIAPFSTSPNLMIREITNPNLISTRVSSRRRQSSPRSTDAEATTAHIKVSSPTLITT